MRDTTLKNISVSLLRDRLLCPTQFVFTCPVVFGVETGELCHILAYSVTISLRT